MDSLSLIQGLLSNLRCLEGNQWTPKISNNLNSIPWASCTTACSTATTPISPLRPNSINTRPNNVAFISLNPNMSSLIAPPLLAASTALLPQPILEVFSTLKIQGASTTSSSKATPSSKANTATNYIR